MPIAGEDATWEDALRATETLGDRGDAFYYRTLCYVSHEDCCMDILKFLCFSNFAFPFGKGLSMLAEILGHQESDVEATLRDLDTLTFCTDRNILNEHPDDINRPLRVIRKDFKEYLTDRTRSGDFHLDPQTSYKELTRIFLLHLPSIFPTAREMSLKSLLVVCRLFVATCTKITETSDELWRELFELDMDAYLQLLRQTLLPQWDILDLVSQLMLWIKEQEYFSMTSLGFPDSLYLHHLTRWDNWVSSALRPYAQQSHVWRVIASLQHPFYAKSYNGRSFVYMRRILSRLSYPVDDLSNSQFRFTSSGLWVLGGRVSHKSAFFKMFSEYLEDPTRCTELGKRADRDLLMVRTLAEFLFTYLVPTEIKDKSRYGPPVAFRITMQIVKGYGIRVTTSNTYLYAMRWLPGFLKNAGYSNDMAKYLQRNKLNLSSICEGQSAFESAVLSYVSLKKSLDTTTLSEDEQAGVNSTHNTTITSSDECYSCASSSTGLSTGDYGFYWTRRAYSQETTSDDVMR